MAYNYNFVKCQVINKTCFVILNRPEKRNALNSELVLELLDVFKKAEEDSEVKIIVLKAEGKAFCAGADLEYLEKLSKNSLEENQKDSDQLKELFYTIYSSNKIVVTQINGHAVAGGAGLVTVSDFSFAVPEANIGFTEVNLGFIPALVSVFLQKKIGESKTRELLLSGKLISSSTAQSFGLISKVIPPEQIDDTVLKFTNELIDNTSALSISFTKRLLIKNQEPGLSEALKNASIMNAKMRETEDFKKGVRAFLNKEIPKWNE